MNTPTIEELKALAQQIPEKIPYLIPTPEQVAKLLQGIE
jgi:hypothetical protein